MNIRKLQRTIINNNDMNNNFQIQNSFIIPPSNFSLTQNNNPYLIPNSTCNYNNIVPQLLEFQTNYNSSYTTTTNNNNSSRRSNNEANNEAANNNEQVEEKKQRRMVSNRESARRSRMRKKRQINELWSQVLWLKNENQDLLQKLNSVSQAHTLVLQQNIELKEETSNLRQMLCYMKLGTNIDDDDDVDLHNNAFRDL